MDVDYKELLKRAQSQIPKKALEHKRFEIPRPRCSVIGMRTIIHNFKEIANTLNRDPGHLLKFLSKEMATAGTLEGPRAVFQGKFRYNTIERLIRGYTQDFVICPVCDRPDTRIVKEKRLYFLKCDACGARSSIRQL